MNIYGITFVIFIAFVLGFAAATITMNNAFHYALIQRDLGGFCPTSGAFAFKGECK